MAIRDLTSELILHDEIAEVPLVTRQAFLDRIGPERWRVLNQAAETDDVLFHALTKLQMTEVVNVSAPEVRTISDYAIEKNWVTEDDKQRATRPQRKDPELPAASRLKRRARAERRAARNRTQEQVEATAPEAEPASE